MKKLAIGLLLVFAGIGAIGLATLQTTVHMISAATSSSGSLATNDFAGSSSSASSRGPSGTSVGDIGKCPHFIVIEGSCSESEAK